MIQRIQSIWLFLSGLVLLALFIFPYVNYVDLVGLGRRIFVSGIYSFANNIAERQETYYLQMIYTILLSVFPIFIIFKYANRKLQLRLIYLQIVLVIFLTVWMYISASNALSPISQYVNAGNMGVGFFIPPISILLLGLAISGIRKDEKLIKSADRLR